jgi:hypothetical protein
VKAGIKQFKHMWKNMPEEYEKWEGGEAYIQGVVDQPVTILKDRRGGETKPMSLTVLRERLEEDPTLYGDADWGGCGCIIGEEGE